MLTTFDPFGRFLDATFGTLFLPVRLFSLAGSAFSLRCNVSDLLVRSGVLALSALLALGLSACSPAAVQSAGATLPGAQAQAVSPARAVSWGLYASARAADVDPVSNGRALGNVKKQRTPLYVPIGLAVNANRELYVANHYNGSGQILVYSPSGTQIPGRTITYKVSNPAGLAFDASGNLYEADQTAVSEYSPNGTFIRSITTDPAYQPSGTQIDPATGNIWVALRTGGNIGIGEIQIFSPAGTIVNTINQGLVYPLGIAFSPTTGLAWVCNSETPQGNSFSLYNSAGVYQETVPTDITPGYLSFDKKADFWASDALGAQVNHYDQNGTDLGGTLTQDISAPYGIAIDSKGFIYVANVGNNTVTKYSSKGVLVKVLI
jgi:sugar lactone lactonase YvrE